MEGIKRMEPNNNLRKGREIIDKYVPVEEREFWAGLAKDDTPEDDKHLDTPGLIEFAAYEKEWDVRQAQKDKEAQEKLKKLEEDFPLQDRILAVEQMKAKERLEKEAKEFGEAEENYGSNLPLLSLTDLLKKDFPAAQWLVQGLMPQKGLIAISGSPASYKSWITQHLALSVATGTPLFDKFETQQRKVLIIDKENQMALIQKRFKDMGAFEGLDIYFLDSDDFYIENEQIIHKLCNRVCLEGIGLIIFDSLIRIHRNKEENSAGDMAEVFRQLRRFQEAGATVVFVHHHRKGSIFARNSLAEAMRGSSDILASVDSHLAVEVEDEYIKVSQPKLRYDLPVKPFKIKLESNDGHVEFKFLGELEEEKEKTEQAKRDIYVVLEEGEISRVGLIERFKGIYGSKTIDSALKSFTPEEVVVRLGERGKKFYHRADIDVEGGLFNPVSQNGSI